MRSVWGELLILRLSKKFRYVREWHGWQSQPMVKWFCCAIYGHNPSYLSERFPTEVRATASGFIYHQGAIWGGLVAPVLTYLAVQMNFGFAMPMMISTILFLVLVVISVLLGPETKGKTLTADLEVVKVVPQPAT